MGRPKEANHADSRSPLRVFQGEYRAENAKGVISDLYFNSQHDMLDAIQDDPGKYTPMRWDRGKNCYVVDWDSADILGQ